MAGQEEIASIRRRLIGLDDERSKLVSRLEQLQASPPAGPQPDGVTNSLSVVDKIALFRRLFAGRLDVFPVRWENQRTGRSGYAPACDNEWVRGVCGKPQVKCGECTNQAFIPMNDDVVECHLRGDDRIRPNARGQDFVLGVYPLLFDDTCRFLAVDFDGETWALDALAFLETSRLHQAPTYLERSRSGNGGHIWIFFLEPIAASQARRLGHAAPDKGRWIGAQK
jgi:hypothetical protein